MVVLEEIANDLDLHQLECGISALHAAHSPECMQDPDCACNAHAQSSPTTCCRVLPLQPCRSSPSCRLHPKATVWSLVQGSGFRVQGYKRTHPDQRIDQQLLGDCGAGGIPDEVCQHLQLQAALCQDAGAALAHAADDLGRKPRTRTHHLHSHTQFSECAA